MFAKLRKMEEKTRATWIFIQTNLLLDRRNEVRNPAEGQLFRGVNPDLAKVLSGLLGMQGGIMVDPTTGKFKAKDPYDPTDPFACIIDPGFAPQQSEEENSEDEYLDYNTDDSERTRKAKDRRRRKRRKRKKVAEAIQAGLDPAEMVDNDSMEEEEQGHDSQADADDDIVLLAKEGNAVAAVAPQLAEMHLEKKTEALQGIEQRRQEVEGDTALDEFDKQEKLQKLDKEREIMTKMYDAEMGAMAAVVGSGDQLEEHRQAVQRREAELEALEERLISMERSVEQRQQELQMRLEVEENQAVSERLQKEMEAKQEALRKLKEEKTEAMKALEKENQVLREKVDILERMKSAGIGDLMEGATEELGNEQEQDMEDVIQQNPDLAKEVEQKKSAIEHQYHLDNLMVAAKNTVDEALQWAMLEVSNERKKQISLGEKQKRIEELQRQREAQEREQADLKAKEQTEDELKRIMAQAQQDREEIDAKLETQRARMQRKLQERLAARKMKGQAEAQRKKEAALRMEEEKVQDAIRAGKRKAEVAKCLAVLNKIPENERRERAKDVIEMVLRPRFNRENENMLKFHFEQRSQYFQQALESEKDPDFSLIEKKVNAELDQPHAEDLSKLKIRQHEDVKAIFKDIYPDEDLSDDKWEVGELEDVGAYLRKRKEVLARQRKKIDEDYEKQMQKLREEQEAKKKSHEQKMQEDQAEFDRLVAEADERAKARNQKMLELREEIKRKELEQMQGLGEQQKEEILAEHRKNLRQYGMALDAERMRQRDNFVKKLNARRKKQQQRKERMEKKKFEEEKRRLKELKDRKKRAKGDGAEGGGRGRARDTDTDEEDQKFQEAQKQEAERVEKERREVQEKKQVMETLARIEQMMLKIDKGAEEWRDRIYIDERDEKEFQENGQNLPEVCEATKLSSQAFVVYRFGLALLAMLAESGVIRAKDEKPLRLLLADSLPRNPHQQVAFRNSFNYDKQHNTLFIRKERVDSVGQFLLVLLHAVAHITVSSTSDGWDDRNPEFIRKLHQCLNLICADMFFSRCQQTGAGAGFDLSRLGSNFTGVAFETLQQELENSPLTNVEQAETSESAEDAVVS